MGLSVPLHEAEGPVLLRLDILPAPHFMGMNTGLLLGEATHAGAKLRAHLCVGAAVHTPVPISPNAISSQTSRLPPRTPQPCSKARVGDVTPAPQPPNSFAVKETWVTHVLAQPPFLDLRTSPMGFKGNKASCCPPSFAISMLASQYCFISSPSPGHHTVIVFTLLKGVQILLPQAQKKMEPLEEQKGEPMLKGAFLLSRGAPAARMGAGLNLGLPASVHDGKFVRVVFLRFRSKS